MLKRSIQTAQFFDEDEFDIKQMRMLDELNAGAMEGMTYEDIRAQHHDEYEMRKSNKMAYRYPGEIMGKRVFQSGSLTSAFQALVCCSPISRVSSVKTWLISMFLWACCTCWSR